MFVFYSLGCEEEINIKLLKSNGYVETSCNKVNRYELNDSSFIEINKGLEGNKNFVLARCFNDKSCIFNIEYETEKITCQRYIVNKKNQYSNGFLNVEHREYLEHRVLYFLFNEDK